jgi:hypothetical protein
MRRRIHVLSLYRKVTIESIFEDVNLDVAMHQAPLVAMGERSQGFRV